MQQLPKADWSEDPLDAADENKHVIYQWVGPKMRTMHAWQSDNMDMQCFSSAESKGHSLQSAHGNIAYSHLQAIEAE